MNRGTPVPATRHARRRLVSLLAAFALVFSGLTLTGLAGSAAADETPVFIEGVTLDWKGNLATQIPPDFGGSIYFSVGASVGDEASYSAESGNVKILHVTPGGAESVPTYATRAAFIAAGNTQIVRLSNGEAVLQPDGSAAVTWDGAWSVNFYGGIIPFTMTDPVLTVGADGTGTLTADMSGYVAPIADPSDKTPLPPIEDAVIADFSGVEIDPEGEITIAPHYAGVELDVPPGGTAQNRVVEGWGSWPQSFVNFHFASGLSSHWYSSNTSAERNGRKPPYPFVVDFSDGEQVPALNLEGVSLDWKGSPALQLAPDFGGSNYFSAGASAGDEASYSADTGTVKIFQVSPGGEETLATYATRAVHVASGGTQVVRLLDGEAAIQADGSATVSWDGAWSVNFYGGVIPFTMTDPVLAVDADGTGTLTADMSGYTAPIADPSNKTPIPPIEDAVIADFSGVEIHPAGAITIDPHYAGVEIEVPPGGTAQNRVVAGWGSWPQTFVNFHFASGLSSHWYSSTTSDLRNSRKPPLPFTVNFTGAKQASVITINTPASVAYGRKNLAIKPLVSNSSGRPVTLVTESAGVCALINKGKAVRFDGPGTCAITGTSTGNAQWAPGHATVQIEVRKAVANVQKFNVAPKKAKPGIARTLKVVVKRVSAKATGDLAGTVTITDAADNVVATIQVPAGSTKPKVKVQTSLATAGIPALTTVKLTATYSGNDTYQAKLTKPAQFRVKKG